MNRVTKTIAAITAVCLLSVSGVAFAIAESEDSGCSGLQVETVKIVIGRLDKNKDWISNFIQQLEAIKCNQIAFHFRGAAMTKAPACEGTTTCSYQDDEGGGDTPIEDCDIVDGIVSCS